MKYSMSLFVIYFGTKRQYRDQGLAHHNIILGRVTRACDGPVRAQASGRRFLAVPAHAQPDRSVGRAARPRTFYALSPVPHLESGVDWAQAARPYRDAIMQFLEGQLLRDLQANLVAEHFVDPRHFHTALNSHKGRLSRCNRSSRSRHGPAA